MQEYQRKFLDFAIQLGVLRFGEFTLKSGRQSPYFFNSGLFNTGASLANLGRFYAQAVVSSGIEFDMIYGPAYKGIPLAASLSIALADHHQRDIPYCFNRKEAKDHGEGGMTVGAPLAGRVLIIDDVISAGTSVRESVELIRSAGATPSGVVIALDRQERGKQETSAIQEVERDYGLSVVSIVSLEDLIAYLEQKSTQDASLQAIKKYQSLYGILNYT